jgi:hypothetical protein
LHIRTDNEDIKRIQSTSPTLRRLWLASLALALFLLTLALGNFALPQSRSLTPNLVGHDFLAFYTAGAFLNDHRSHDLYDLDRVRAFQDDLAAREHLELGQSFGPFWNPPFYAWVFAPLARLPYPTALDAWEAFNLVCLFVAIRLLTRLLQPAPRTVTLLVPLLLLTSMPLIQAFTHGQNTPGSLLLLAIVANLWRARRAFPAGLVAGLLLYKPQLGALVALAVIFTLGRRAALGLAITSLALLAVTLLTLPGVAADYLARMPGNLRQFQVFQPYLWDRHVTLRAFWRLLLQGKAAGDLLPLTQACYLLSAAALAALLARAFWRNHRLPSAQNLQPLMAAVIVTMPLLMPFYFDYDLLLLAVPAVLCARLRLDTPATGSDKPLTRLWIALYFWLMVNSAVARLTHVNVSVILLGALAVLLIRRAMPSQSPLHTMPRSGRVSVEQACPQPHLV